MESLPRTAPSARPAVGRRPVVPAGVPTTPFEGVLRGLEREAQEAAPSLPMPTWSWVATAPQVSGVLSREGSTRALEASELGADRSAAARVSRGGDAGGDRSREAVEPRAGIGSERSTRDAAGGETRGTSERRAATQASGGQNAPASDTSSSGTLRAAGMAAAPSSGAPAAQQALAALAQAARGLTPGAAAGSAGQAPAGQSATPLTSAVAVSGPGAGSVTSASATTKAAAQPARMAQAESILGQVRMALSPRTRTAVLRLDPAELGRLRVELRVDQGKAHAHLIVERPEALAALESHLPELRALFEQQGLEIEGFEVVLAEPGDETPFEDRGAESSARSSTNASSGEPEEDLDPARVARHLTGDSALDLIA